MGRPVPKALLQGPDRPLAAVLGGELPLGLRDLLDCLLEVPARRLAALEDAGLVEVDVGLDEARPHEAPRDVQDLGVRREAGLDGRDPAAVDPDVHRNAVFPAGDSRVLEDEVHGTSQACAGRRPARLVNGSGYPKPPRRAYPSIGFSTCAGGGSGPRSIGDAR